jgi:hypothetical protein
VPFIGCRNLDDKDLGVKPNKTISHYVYKYTLYLALTSFEFKKFRAVASNSALKDNENEVLSNFCHYLKLSPRVWNEYARGWNWVRN